MTEDDDVTPVALQRIPTRSWLVLAWLTVAILLVVLALVTWRYLALRAQLDQACAPDSVVARLDLTEWVPLCR